MRDNHPDQIDKFYAVFISNDEEKTLLFKQKFGAVVYDHAVCWDYHVILIYSDKSNDVHLVYDFDTILPFPSDFNQYADGVFKSNNNILFRVIPASQYLLRFASDRSRMKDKNGMFLQPPPDYPCIQVDGETNNLNKFISMDNKFETGNVLTLDQLKQMFSYKNFNT